jgi:hypothetical protein
MNFSALLMPLKTELNTAYKDKIYIYAGWLYKLNYNLDHVVVRVTNITLWGEDCKVELQHGTMQDSNTTFLPKPYPHSGRGLAGYQERGSKDSSALISPYWTTSPNLILPLTLWSKV